MDETLLLIYWSYLWDLLLQQQLMAMLVHTPILLGFRVFLF